LPPNPIGVTLSPTFTAVIASMYTLPRWARLMFGPSVLRESSALILTARVPIPTMTSADSSA